MARISEGVRGGEILTENCPKCGKPAKSLIPVGWKGNEYALLYHVDCQTILVQDQGRLKVAKA